MHHKKIWIEKAERIRYNVSRIHHMERMVALSLFYPAPILLPKEEDMSKWSVIACDQFTSDPAYWQRVRQQVGNSRSTLYMILPEAELGGNEQEKIAKINEAMLRYCEQGAFLEYPNAYIYVERTLQNGKIRPGLIGMVDLESYDYLPGSQSPIRATEKTVLERIPPRQRVRQDATVEFPHVLMLCDDHEKLLMEPVTAQKDHFQKLYDFDLMEDGGHIAGWLLSEEAARAFDERLAAYTDTYAEKYDDLDGAKVLFAVGDGNHSLATAKSCYEALKAANPNADLSAHPARFALVELENIHDPALTFEPIHRIVTDVNVQELLEAVREVCAEDGFAVECVTASHQETLYLDKSKGELAVAVLQEVLDAYLSSHSGKMDYIHGDGEVVQLARAENTVGFLLPAMEKDQLFRGVISRGALPRKTFSMGHAREKRYYLEGRKIRWLHCMKVLLPS